MCRKKAYLTYTHALWDSKQLTMKKGMYYQVYTCSECDQFHVGSLDDGIFKKRKKELNDYTRSIA